ncbi:MAG TPA: alpha/beta hydrolase, partial [Pseudoxanthomonas sp.]|nr:alpha/beta hydrolase [Pseudoxanthomonas sp.]
PTAIVNGEDDQIINLDYVNSISYASLWQDTCFRVPNVSHSPFWEAPELVNALLAGFLADVTGGKA